MKLLLDQGTPRSAASILREAGFDTVHTGEIGMAAADDPAILGRAELEDRIVITLDADFHMLLALTRARKPSVIRLRIEGLRAEEFSDWVQAILDRCADDLDSGAMVSAAGDQIRIRHLPVA